MTIKKSARKIHSELRAGKGWLPHKDSNLVKLIQSQLCYHYTMRHQIRTNKFTPFLPWLATFFFDADVLTFPVAFAKLLTDSTIDALTSELPLLLCA